MREKKGLPGQRIGDVLRESGAVTDGQLKAALEYQKRHSGLRLGNVLMELGYISEKQMLAALGIRLGLKHGVGGFCTGWLGDTWAGAVGKGTGRMCPCICGSDFGAV